VLYFLLLRHRTDEMIFLRIYATLPLVLTLLNVNFMIFLLPQSYQIHI